MASRTRVWEIWQTEKGRADSKAYVVQAKRTGQGRWAQLGEGEDKCEENVTPKVRLLSVSTLLCKWSFLKCIIRWWERLPSHTQLLVCIHIKTHTHTHHPTSKYAKLALSVLMIGTLNPEIMIWINFVDRVQKYGQPRFYSIYLTVWPSLLMTMKSMLPQPQVWIFHVYWMKYWPLRLSYLVLLSVLPVSITCTIR